MDYLMAHPNLLARLTAKLIKVLMRRGWHIHNFDYWQQQGFMLLRNHFYSPVPDMASLADDHWQKKQSLHGIDMRDAHQLELLTEAFPKFADEYKDFSIEKTNDPFQYFFKCGEFTGSDALVLHCMIRHFKPAQIIEVGAGFSTLISAQAARLNGDTRLTAIEPYPRDFLLQGLPGLSDLVQQKVQDVDIERFTSLTAGDILFIDTSHVVKTGSDVNSLFLDVLPRLHAGVIIHIHDIFLPNDYPRKWLAEDRLFWNEQYLLQAFLMYNTAFEVLFANQYMYLTHPEQMKASFPNAPWLDGGSFWLRKVQ
jgi:hypothetical protein